MADLTADQARWATIADMVADAAERFGSREALVDGRTRLSWSELVDASRSFGAALLASGVERGDRVAIWCFNCSEWVVAALGLFEIGAVLVPINTRFKGAEAAEILQRSGAKVLVTVTDFLGVDQTALLAASGVALPDLEVSIVAHGPTPDGAISWADFVTSATETSRAAVAQRRTLLSRDDPSDILFTSGTTGQPKGVVQTNGRTLHVSTDWASMTGLDVSDRYLMVNPYFHMFGLKAGILACVASGATMYPLAVFDVDAVLDLVDSEAITVLPGAPTIYQSILDHPSVGDRDLSSLRIAVTGAAEIPVELIRRVTSDLPFSTVIAGYGLTEGGTATATHPDDDPETIATTVGRPRPGFEVRLVTEHEDGNDVDVVSGEQGEVLLRSPSIMSHYLDDPDATALVLDADGWLRTGDIGTIDEIGNLRIVGRSKDMFIVGGFNAYPAEIENALMEHPDVRQVAVVGAPDRRLGEVGMAFVVARPGSALTSDGLIEWSRARMANYKVPRYVEIVESLPINASGKVMRKDLRESAAQRPSAP